MVGKILDKQEYNNQQSLTATSPTDGKTRLWIIVTAPGYQPWENAIRGKLNENRPIEITVKMKRMAGLERQG